MRHSFLFFVVVDENKEHIIEIFFWLEKFFSFTSRKNNVFLFLREESWKRGGIFRKFRRLFTVVFLSLVLTHSFLSRQAAFPVSVGVLLPRPFRLYNHFLPLGRKTVEPLLCAGPFVSLLFMWSVELRNTTDFFFFFLFRCLKSWIHFSLGFEAERQKSVAESKRFFYFLQ